jgi:AraC family transcriptional regulator, regulatory protein of adaptative response / methylated-DNA-[protein]-cysteine methyltransferase
MSSFGTQPSREAPRPARELIHYDLGQTSVAAILIAVSAKGVVAILIQERPDDKKIVKTLQTRFPTAELRRGSKNVRAMVEAVANFVEKPRENLSLRLDIRGTDFQRRVWKAASKIPLGGTTTFAAIAREVGAPKAVRAVGKACSQNPLEFAIPCHRVLRSDGSYSGGSDWGDRRQATIVQREAASVAEHHRFGADTNKDDDARLSRQIPSHHRRHP